MRRVLVVDDEEAITDGLTALFELEQIEAAGAYDRETAEEMIRSEYYPVILADLRLKTQEDGLHLLESIRKLSPHSRVASLTAFATPEVEEQLRARGSELVLRKPMDFDEIVEIVLQMLDVIEQEAESRQAESSQPLDLDVLYQDVRKILYAIPQRRYGLTAEETDELVQEAWCLFLERQAGVNHARSWLAGTVVNLCRQQIHRKVRARDVEQELVSEPEMGSAAIDDPAGRERQMMLRQALERLDDRSRQLCVLIGIEGWSYEEVSEELGMPIGSVGPLYIRAKKKLRTAFEVSH